MDKRKNVFPGNLLYLQSSDMAARPLLINSPLNFNRLIINYWGINVQIQLCCPSSVHKCQQRYFMAYAVEHSDSQSPLTLTSQLSEAEKRIYFFFKVIMQTEWESSRNLSWRTLFLCLGKFWYLSFVNKHLHLKTKKTHQLKSRFLN